MTKTSFPDRQSTRLKAYDYGHAGGYFVTINTHKKQKLFGAVVDGEVVLNEVGEMVKKEWMALANRFQGVQIDKFIVMPNHFHGILFLPGSAVGVGLVPTRGSEAGDHKDRPYDETGDVLKTIDGVEDARENQNLQTDAVGVGLVPTCGSVAGDHKGRPYGETGGVSNAPELGEVIGSFKSITTHQYIQGVKTKGWPPFKKKVWHRNYHDRIIRNDKELDNIRHYVMYNAIKEYEAEKYG